MSIKPKKSLGQNFLVDKNIINKICNSVEIKKENIIVEIGPGTGNLTNILINKKPKLIYLIEKDKALFNELKLKFNRRVKIFNEDILNFKFSRIIGEKFLIFGNLPYNISSQILVKFIINKDNLKFEKLVFMFQKELADRIIANTNESNYGRLSILTKWKFNVKKAFDIDPNSFKPKPKIQSSLLVFEPKQSFFKFKNPKNLEKITRILFNQRRKKIKKTINNLFKKDQETLRKIKIDLNLRPQNLEPEKFFLITKEYEKLVD